MMADSLNEHVLQAWERGVGRPIAERALVALEIMAPDARPAASAAVFARDAALMALRISLMGSPLDAVVRCPACDTEFDLPLDLSVFASDAPPAGAVSVEHDGYTAIVRPPDARDLLELSPELPPDAFAETLFHRCVEKATHRGRTVEPAALPPALRTAAAAALSALGMDSPAADLDCGVCGHAWQAPVDIARVLLRDIDTRALRQLDEVQRIASAYHWSERDILALSPARRRFYLEAIG
jgi:hypothetical protein